jgi:hypothetical protein
VLLGTDNNFSGLIPSVNVRKPTVVFIIKGTQVLVFIFISWNSQQDLINKLVQRDCKNKKNTFNNVHDRRNKCAVGRTLFFVERASLVNLALDAFLELQATSRAGLKPNGQLLSWLTPPKWS